MTRNVVLGITGASGAPYAKRLAECLSRTPDVQLHVVISALGRRVLADELDLRTVTAESLVGDTAERVTLHNHKDVGATIASGSFPTIGMVICPASSNTIGAVASGLADNLVTRAALVTLKEARRLILVPREMPLHAIELENLLRISRAGGIVCPACPGFYMRPTRVAELIDFVVGRVLDLFGLPHDLNVRWDPEATRGTERAPE